jgi:hypothetical protein
MTSPEFKRIARLLKEVYKDLEERAIRNKIDIFGEEYKRLQDAARLNVLKRFGFTLDEYRAAKEIVAPANRVSTSKSLERAREDIETLYETVSDLEIPDEEELLKKVHEIAEAVVKPPVIKKEIVERTTVEKPTIVKETVNKTINEKYEDGPLWAELGYIQDRLENLPEPTEPDYEALKDEIRNDFAIFLEHNTNVFDMPDFRKLSMGLQAQVDTKIEGVGVTKITVSDTEPDSPNVNDLWIDTDAYTYRAVTTTDTITSTDYLLDCTGTFTITLPTAVGFTGEYIIKNTGTGIITVDGNGSQTIDGVTTFALIEDEVITLRSTGTNWLII